MISEDLLQNRNFKWFDIESPEQKDFEDESVKFKFPQLLIQDTLRPEHLPKYESTDDGHFLMLRSYDPESTMDSTTVRELTRKIALFISDDRMVTIHRVKLGFITKTKERFQKSESPKTIQALVHQLVLASIRTYEKPASDLLEQYDSFEEEVLSKQKEQLDTTQLFIFRRRLFVIKRILKQTGDALSRSKEFWDEYPSMLQDLKENIDQIYFQLDEIADNFEHLFELHIAINDQRANEVMKILTVFSTVLLPLNFIASFYGMNFEYIPGLKSEHAFHWVIMMMVVVSLTGFWFFKRKGWFNTPRE